MTRARPTVSVVMPFAGDAQAAHEAIAALLALEPRAGDQLLLADNSGTAHEARGVTVVRATGEESPAHARNVGAEAADGDWLLFIDADCRPRPGLIDAYFEEPPADGVGALVGEVRAAADGQTVAARYGAARGFLGQTQHLAHPYRPRAAAANLAVRREAFEQVGGFYEGLRAAEDTDFSWRLQAAGWSLELRPDAWVEHRYRTTLPELRRQWRGYAAGRAWLSRRYPDFAPEPAAARAASRVGRRRGSGPRASGGGPSDANRRDRARYLAIDVLLAGDELAGFALSNRPGTRELEAADGPLGAAAQPTPVVLVADRFPAPGDLLVDFARTVDGARVEAVSRPDPVATEAFRELRIDYQEDDGRLLRLTATARLLLRHPVRCVLDVLGRGSSEPPLAALAPAVRRLEHDPQARIHPLGFGEAQTIAVRLAALAGRSLDRSR